jgi:hypothetical protein
LNDKPYKCYSGKPNDTPLTKGHKNQYGYYWSKGISNIPTNLKNGLRKSTSI